LAERQAHRCRGDGDAGDLVRGQGAALWRAGKPDQGGRGRSRRIAWGSYGGKVGVWRIINLLKQNGIRGTFCVNGRCAEIFPEAVEQIVKSGHDVAGHAYLQDQLMAYMTPEEEQRTIRQCLDLLEKASGMRPQGWVSPVMAYTRTRGTSSLPRG
jgi:peptidoglycan/xylan/chitin deacetylase (PgdA/CDA1 family)